MIKKHTYAFEAFTTYVKLSAYGDVDVCQAAYMLVRNRCEEYEALFSRTRESSDVWKLNNSHGTSTQLDVRTGDLLGKALRYCKASDGLFDISIGSLVALWDFRQAQVADPELLEKMTDLVGFKSIRFDAPNCVSIEKEGAAIDLGGIAKGWIADAIYEELLRFDLEGFVLDLGGNIIVGGNRPDGSPWKIGVKDPRDPMRNVAATGIEQGSVVTSGVYERAFTKNGKFYHHILDPKTGMPVNTNLISATLVCDRSIDAEGYSTAVLALGAEKAQEFLRFMPEIRQAFLVDDEMNFYTYTQ